EQAPAPSTAPKQAPELRTPGSLGTAGGSTRPAGATNASGSTKASGATKADGSTKASGSTKADGTTKATDSTRPGGATRADGTTNAAQASKGPESRVTVTVDDDHLDDVEGLADQLRAEGMTVEQVLGSVGIITGSVSADKRSSIGGVKGVAAVEEEHTFQLPSPEAEVQ
ncbi:MAG: hypothetical protein QOI99_1779, partial [Actinomycetota bacterium]|nr:hypothetical protein [Actinomycetota bacterium]